MKNIKVARIILCGIINGVRRRREGKEGGGCDPFIGGGGGGWHCFFHFLLFITFMNNIFPLSPCVPLGPPTSQDFFLENLSVFSVFGVRFSLYLASWLFDFDLFFSVCVVFAPLFCSPD